MEKWVGGQRVCPGDTWAARLIQLLLGVQHQLVEACGEVWGVAREFFRGWLRGPLLAPPEKPYDPTCKYQQTMVCPGF